MPFLVFLQLVVFIGLPGEVTYGQATTPITSSGLNTQVSAPVTLPDGAVQHNITGGTRPGGGGNLFHSFGEFGVPTNNNANFLNDSGLPTSNILSRVTGGNPSNILGMIKTEGFEKANLFLMNPAGVVFGQNATLHVGGAAYFTTADYLRLNDGVQFTAVPGAHDALLSIAPVAAFGFLGTNPAPISVDGSTLSVEEGQTLSLVGGDMTIGSSALIARSGKIAVASVASPGEVLTETFASASNVSGEAFTRMGNITLSEGATLDVSADSAGTVIIRGGELIMANAVISADTVNENGAPVAIDIDVTGNVSLSTVNGLALTARTSGTGNAGEIKLSSDGAMDISGMAGGNLPFPVISIIDTHSSGVGNAGNVTLASQGDMTGTGDFPEGLVFLADTGMDGLNTGKGGDLSISARNFTIRNAFIATGNYVSTLIGEGVGDGPAGNVSISANEGIDVSVSQILTDSDGNAGNVTLTAPDINFDNSKISTTGFSRGGNVNIDADTLTLSNASEVVTITRTEPGGAVTITGRIVELSASNIVSTTKENADAGNITITATERLSLLNPGAPLSDEDQTSSIASNSFENFNDIRGEPGNILIETPLLTMDGGSKINSSSGS
ncbi:MAG: filamentous hemagglutinin N-terminal domain-containing protein, partial [Nitrospirales bacterium]|nr:filamentous hemagglutinin N-terminal domain-containing protein [Nitrospirales bacterium]